MQKRTFTAADKRGLSVEQKEYLTAHPDMVSLQPHSMLLPRDQLYKTFRHGAVTIDRAMELDAIHDRFLAQEARLPAQGIAYDNYSDAEDRFIDRHGISSGLF